MECVPYSVRYQAQVVSWLSKRGLEERLAYDLPATGFMVFKDGHGVATGFIRRIEGDMGMVDGYLTNPDAHWEDRDKALDLLTKAIIDKAIELKMKSILAFTKDFNTLTRSLRHGYSHLSEQKMIVYPVIRT